MIVQICVGSSCHLKGSAAVIELMQAAVQKNGLEKEVELAGSFCMGTCNRSGVTVSVDGEVHVGINRENFTDFFNECVLAKIKG